MGGRRGEYLHLVPLKVELPRFSYSSYYQHSTTFPQSGYGPGKSMMWHIINALRKTLGDSYLSVAVSFMRIETVICRNF
jgi:hypothetical protein